MYLFYEVQRQGYTLFECFAKKPDLLQIQAGVCKAFFDKDANSHEMGDEICPRGKESNKGHSQRQCKANFSRT
eukprot:scaffold347393_cov38-Prasinocladus_malaysianus.AAC.2